MLSDQRPIVVLSPHLDDAVLSAWHAVSAGGTRVVSVFAGVPADGFVTDLDRSHGAVDSAEWLRRRRREDLAALQVGEATATHLDLLEVQFPAFEVPEIRERIAADTEGFLRSVAQAPGLRTPTDVILAVLDGHLPPDALVYAPVGFGGHPDHRDLAAAAVLLAARGDRLRLYADSPYYLFDGLPTWLDESDGDESDPRVARTMAVSGADQLRLQRSVVRLSDEQFAAKTRAIGRYTTETSGIESALAKRGVDAEMLRFEVYWSVK